LPTLPTFGCLVGAGLSTETPIPHPRRSAAHPSLGRLRRVGIHIHWAVYSALYGLLWDCPHTNWIGRQTASEVERLGPTQVVEVGSGTGLITKELIPVAPHLIACEPNRRMRSRLEQSLPGVDIRPIAAEELELGPQGGRVIVLVNVLHLIDDPSGALGHLRALAGRNGNIVAVSPTPESSVLRVAVEQWSRGSSLLRALRFVVLHIAMAPLTVVSGAARDPGPAFSVLRLHATHTRKLGTSLTLFVIPGSQ
jgi:SAM-dependent methyltransferase